MNHIPELAKILGVEVGEEFAYQIGEQTQEYRLKFTQDSLVYVIKDKVFTPDSIALAKLINGEYKVIKLPWKPGRKEDFYFVNSNGIVSSLGWASSETFKAGLILMENCFRTKDEAEEHRDKIIEKYKGVFKE